MFKLYRYLKYYKKEVILGPLFKLFEAILELFIPFVMTKYIMVHMDQGKSFILLSGCILILIGVIGFLSSLCCQRMASRASQGFGTRVRRDLFSHIQQLSYKELDSIETSSLLVRLSTDINQVQTSVAMLIRLVVRAPFLVIGGIVMSYITTQNIYIVLIFLATAILIAILLFIIMKTSVPFLKKSQKELDKVTNITKENIEGARTVRAFSCETKEQERFNNQSEALKQMDLKVFKISSLLNPITYVVLNLGIIAILYFSGLQQAIQYNELIALVQYMNQILVALLVVANLVVIFTKASASANRIIEVFDIKSSIQNGTEKTGIEKASIEFQDVSFGYHEDSLVLQNISFKVSPGEILGIIGPTGCGKTTLVELLMRFYKQSKGTIFVNSKPIESYDLTYLRDRIGFVASNSTLFHGTIKSNLLIKNKAATPKDIEDSLYNSISDEIVRGKEKGLNEVVLQNGRNFSGGQIARLSIARTIINHPDILILDDSSSALDYKTDRLLQERIKKEFKDKIIILVSQRVRTLAYASKILVLQNGEMVGYGTKDELKKTCDFYKEIASTQENQGETYE